MRDLQKRTKNLPIFLFDFLRLTISAFNDYVIKIKVMITKENYIGRYVGICNSSEIRQMFEDCISGGFCGFVIIKLFAMPNCSDYETCTEELLSHESLHLVLGKINEYEARRKLDNIHKSFYVLDYATNKWKSIVEFVHEKSGHITII